MKKLNFVILFLIPIFLYCLFVSDTHGADKSISVTIKEDAINKFLKSLLPIKCVGTNFLIKSKALGLETKMVSGTINWKLYDPIISIAKNEVNIHFSFHIDADIQPLGINLIEEKPEFSDTERVSAKVGVSYENQNIVFLIEETKYPIDIKIPIKGIKPIKVFDLNLSEVIPKIEYPLDVNANVHLLSKLLYINSNPQIQIIENEIELYLNTNDIFITSKGSAILPPMPPIIETIDIDDIVASTIDWAYEKQKEAIRKFKEEAEKSAKIMYEVQKEAINQAKKEAEKTAEKAYVVQKKVIMDVKKKTTKIVNKGYEKQKKFFKKISPW